MPQIIRHLGDDGGHGHELKSIHQDDGTIVLLSRNPDTEEQHRIVMLENQWRLFLRVLLEIYGKEKCCFYRTGGICGPFPVQG